MTQKSKRGKNTISQSVDLEKAFPFAFREEGEVKGHFQTFYTPSNMWVALSPPLHTHTHTHTAAQAPIALETFSILS